MTPLAFFESFLSTMKKDVSFKHSMVDEELFFSCDIPFSKIKSGKAPEYITTQYVALKMLEEQGKAIQFSNGFVIEPSVIVMLDDITQKTLNLPPVWDGAINADIKGVTNGSSFSVDLAVVPKGYSPTLLYTIQGAFLAFGEESKFLLSPSQFSVFQAHKIHINSGKSEYDNLLFLNSLQLAKKQGCALDLKHFDKLKVLNPQSISIEAELTLQGDLVLTPYMGQNANHEQIQRVLGQLQIQSATTLKVGDEIILFDENKLKAVHEIIKNRVIKSNDVKKFLEKPTAFLDATLVDLDLGFSIRVHGATVFKHAYFGEKDNSNIDWFGIVGKIYPVKKISEIIKDETSYLSVQEQCNDALKTGATVVTINDITYDISDAEHVQNVLCAIKEKIYSSEPFLKLEKHEPKVNLDKEDTLNIVVDIDLNDETLPDDFPDLNKEDLTEPSLEVHKQIKDVLWQEELDWANYKRHPFPHQEEGVRWILGLEEDKEQSKEHTRGALLADDMGLGKTFMALSAIEHVYKIHTSEQKECKPTLIIAPLSLLENWKDEVDKTFYTSPFKDIVILQSDGELPKYRVGGKETELKVSEESELQPQFSLKVGVNFADERLDMPKRLVISTYQTLRDYQFSLCIIDWGVVVFDEAQNIKNPNALQTRAAKGLKADFKLLATGTPVENSLADFWCLMDTACPGYLKTYQEFRTNYILPITRAAADEIEEVRNRLGRELRLKVGALMLRRIKEDNLKGLPNKYLYAGISSHGWKFVEYLSSTMTGYQREKYDEFLDSHNTMQNCHVLTTLQGIRDCSLHPKLCNGGSLDIPKQNKIIEKAYNESGKLLSLCKVLNDIKNKKEKCIIFVINKRLQSFLCVTLGVLYNLGPLSVINGDTKAVSKNDTQLTRKKIIADFEEKFGFNIIIMSPVAAGVGLTVTGANHVIHLERHWNPAKEAQATDRVYRIGQTKDVHVYIPLLEHPEHESFDVNLHKLLMKKTILKDAVVTPEDVIPTPGGFGKDVLSGNKLTRIDEISLNLLSWKEFEALCVELLARHYVASSAWLTNEGKDFGADGIILSDTHNVLIQSKYISRKYDGYKAIQEVHSAKPIYEKAIGKNFEKLIFMTNAPSLAARTTDIAKDSTVEILGRDRLIDLLNTHCITYKDILNRLGKDRMVI